MEHKFKLSYDLAEGAADAELVMNKLAEAGCTDAVVALGTPGRLRLEFVREAQSREDAVLSAIASVCLALPEAALDESEDAGVPENLTIQQAAKVLHVSPAYVDQLVRAGRFSSVEAGRADSQSYPLMLARDEVFRRWRESKERQARGLAAMMEESEHLGVYEQESTKTQALSDAFLQQDRSLPGLLDRLLKATPPDSVERCELVARIEKLLELFEEPEAEESSGPPSQTTLDAIADARAGRTGPTSPEGL